MKNRVRLSELRSIVKSIVESELDDDMNVIEVGDVVEVDNEFMGILTVRVIELVDDVLKAVGAEPGEDLGAGAEGFHGPGFVGEIDPESGESGRLVFPLNHVLPGSKMKGYFPKLGDEFDEDEYGRKTQNPYRKMAKHYSRASRSRPGDYLPEGLKMKIKLGRLKQLVAEALDPKNYSHIGDKKKGDQSSPKPGEELSMKSLGGGHVGGSGSAKATGWENVDEAEKFDDYADPYRPDWEQNPNAKRRRQLAKLKKLPKKTKLDQKDNNLSESDDDMMNEFDSVSERPELGKAIQQLAMMMQKAPPGDKNVRDLKGMVDQLVSKYKEVSSSGSSSKSARQGPGGKVAPKPPRPWELRESVPGTSQCTLELDLTVDVEDVDDYLAKWHLTGRVVDPSGPGGGWPVVDVTGDRKSLSKFVREYAHGDKDEYEWLMSMAKDC